MKKTILIPILAGLLAPAAFILASWAAPTLTPPQGNVPAPINVSGNPQAKAGDLTINGKLKAAGSTGAFVLPSGQHSPENGSMWIQ